MYKPWLLCLALGLGPVTSAGAADCAGADPEALNWLDRMSRSTQEVAFHGVVTLQRGDEMQVMQVAHSVSGDSSSESLTKLTGQGARVVRRDHPLDCVHPGHRLLQLGAALQEGSCGVARFYRFQMGPGERIAGREAVAVRVEPRDLYRYGYLMQLDQETGLLLKSSTLGRGERVLERFQFADLSYGEPGARDNPVDVEHEASHPRPAIEAESAALAGGWSPAWLPRGFALTDDPSDQPRRRTYSDGLAAFSIFLEPLSREIKPGEGVVREGSTTSYTRGLHLGGRPVLITVLGEIPVNTARMVADSVRWVR